MTRDEALQVMQEIMELDDRIRNRISSGSKMMEIWLLKLSKYDFNDGLAGVQHYYSTYHNAPAPQAICDAIETVRQPRREKQRTMKSAADVIKAVREADQRSDEDGLIATLSCRLMDDFTHLPRGLARKYRYAAQRWQEHALNYPAIRDYANDQVVYFQHLAAEAERETPMTPVRDAVRSIFDDMAEGDATPY